MESNKSSYPPAPTSPRSARPTHSSIAAFKLDEGFSEDPRGQDEDGLLATIDDTSRIGFEEWVMAQSEDSRADIAYEVLRTLRTANIAAVVDRLTPLLHMDPVGRLPPEITSLIFSYLDASTLLIASLSSQAWRSRILDPRLWRRLYYDQGWGVDAKAVSSFEDKRARLACQDVRRIGSYPRTAETGRGQPVQKKRATANFVDQQSRDSYSRDISLWREQHGPIEADAEPPDKAPTIQVDHEMTDADSELSSQPSLTRHNKRASQESRDEMVISPIREQKPTILSGHELSPPVKSPLTVRDRWGDEKINWACLYKQRRRLEENWTKGRFTNFQLPHPAFPHEAHRECVYTIQFFGRWLVSGSRDKTLRVWDLETRRLRGAPLTGHTQSVLCLQFDPTEKEDVIISGSSDTNVIVWRFSTGQKIKEIQQAHRDPVLNLRFDHRYLVTCSKDKLIKVWNRHELSPLDKDYPRVNPASTAKLPSYIIDTSSMAPHELEQKLASRQIRDLQPYSLLMALDGHNAAVNAIQIDQDQIVSASGDRLIKVWSVVDGRLISTLPGHQKGIACVQFDSKRIVSGSSDHTVRIYDHVKKCEVAILRGHTNLVRTVQAGFGDLPNSDQVMAEQVRLAEAEYRRAVAAGEIIHQESGAARMSRAQQETCKSPAQYLTAFGAALPPGGGGSQWGRIVSGSYDETIIIWRKDADGRWIQGQSLRQEAAIRAGAAADLRAYNEGQTIAGGAPAVGPHNSIHVPAVTAVTQAGHRSAPPASASTPAGGNQNVAGTVEPLQTTRETGPSSAISNHYPSMAPGAQQAFAQLNAHQHNIQTHLSNLQPNVPSNHGPAGPSSSQPLASANGVHVASTLLAPANQNGQQMTGGHNPVNNAAAPGASQAGPASAGPAAHPNPNPQQQQQQQQPQQGNPAPPLPQQPASRVFKLQFDARRIVCCSQDPRIVGWDFAAGDPGIIEASQFFLGP